MEHMNQNIRPARIKDTERLENNDKDTYQEFSRKWPFYLFFHTILHPFSERTKEKEDKYLMGSFHVKAVHISGAHNTFHQQPR